MVKTEIIKDIENIIDIQKLKIERVCNSVRYIFEDDSPQIDSIYDIDDFKKKCRWGDLRQDIVSDNLEKKGFNQLFKLSESFIDMFSEDIGWYLISKNIEISEDYIQKNLNKVNWAMISQFQNLSEEFIEKNLNKVSWSKISLGQKRLSENFIWKYKNKLNINNVIIFNKAISEEFKNKIKVYRWV